MPVKVCGLSFSELSALVFEVLAEVSVFELVPCKLKSTRVGAIWLIVFSELVTECDIGKLDACMLLSVLVCIGGLFLN